MRGLLVIDKTAGTPARALHRRVLTEQICFLLKTDKVSKTPHLMPRCRCFTLNLL